MNIVRYKRIPFVISSILFLTSVILLFTIGLKPGIDFTGGSLVEVTFMNERPSIEDVRESLAHLQLGEVQVQPTGEDAMIIRTRFITETEHQGMLETLRTAFFIFAPDAGATPEKPRTEDGSIPVNFDDTDGVVELVMGEDGEISMTDVVPLTLSVREERIETVGPSISENLKERTWEITLIVLLSIILYIAYAFRKVSKPVSSWKFGVTAVIALIHDVMVTVGVFVLLGHFFGIEVNIPFVVAILTILGYSVNDTIVVFDRIRENLIKIGYSKFELVINKGVSETLVRSLGTSCTTLIVLFALFFFGGETIKYFALALIVGIGFGTYSSIFLASPLLVVWEKLGKK